MSLEVKVRGLMIDPVSSMPIIILKNSSGDQVLPIWVGIFEANAIAMELEKIVSPRPMTHDLLKDVIQALSGGMEKVVITDLRDNTFYAMIHIKGKDGSVAVDARPSDAIALALRAGAPIHIEERVMEQSSATGEDSAALEAERLRRWLEKIDPEELGHYEM
ncbi:MAG: bifunctional nuclease family protein [Acidobacteria bacterium]|uniref:Bifunctional nuclease family protein n=1 Tax=Candidatus Polarisedimenticola svalbardensis TaxID=2886004 RepID=A0A8J7C224_9BACT|nr:bifunctional nuclease family protein [Candidatus Polarisedimenticola svalbardensis]